MGFAGTSRACIHCFFSMLSERASGTVLAQALALFFLSNFFLIFFMGVLFFLGIENSERPGYSPTFQIFFLGEGAAVEVEVEGRAQRTVKGLESDRGVPGTLVGRVKELREKEKEKEKTKDGIVVVIGIGISLRRPVSCQSKI